MEREAQNAALMAAAAAVGVAIVRKLNDGETPSVRIGLGGFVLALFLTGLVEINANLGKQMSRLVLVASLFVFGDSFWPIVQTALNRDSEETPQ